MIEKKPFVNYKLEEERTKDKGKIFTIRLNSEEIEYLKKGKKILNQEKDSTALKQLALFGLYVLHDRSTGYILNVLTDNLRKNKRTGIHIID